MKIVRVCMTRMRVYYILISPTDILHYTSITQFKRHTKAILSINYTYRQHHQKIIILEVAYSNMLLLLH